MEKETLKKFVGQRVKILLRNNNIYTLVINDVTDIDFSATDKFGNIITISNEEIMVIESTGKGGEK